MDLIEALLRKRFRSPSRLLRFLQVLLDYIPSTNEQSHRLLLSFDLFSQLLQCNEDIPSQSSSCKFYVLPYGVSSLARKDFNLLYTACDKHRGILVRENTLSVMKCLHCR